MTGRVVHNLSRGQILIMVILLLALLVVVISAYQYREGYEQQNTLEDSHSLDQISAQLSEHQGLDSMMEEVVHEEGLGDTTSESEEIPDTNEEVPVPDSTPEPENVPPDPEPVPTPPVEEPIETESSENCVGGTFNQDFLCLINDHRVQNGKEALVYDAALNSVASSHSTWQSNNDTLSHEGENGSSAGDRCQAGGTTCYAENVAYAFTDVLSLFNLWKSSPGHNTNMLGTQYTHVGLGTDGLYATLLLR